jgi:hypothetical protein
VSARERALDLLRENGGDDEVRELMSVWEREAISCAAPKNSVATSKRL